MILELEQVVKTLVEYIVCLYNLSHPNIQNKEFEIIAGVRMARFFDANDFLYTVDQQFLENLFCPALTGTVCKDRSLHTHLIKGVPSIGPAGAAFKFFFYGYLKKNIFDLLFIKIPQVNCKILKVPRVI